MASSSLVAPFRLTQRRACPPFSSCGEFDWRRHLAFASQIIFTTIFLVPLIYEIFRSDSDAFALFSKFIIFSFRFELQGISIESAEKGILRLIELVLDDDNAWSVSGTINNYGSSIQYTSQELNPVAAALSCVCSATPNVLLVSATAELLCMPVIIRYIPLAAFCPVLATSSTLAPVHQGVGVDCIMKHPITRCDSSFFVPCHDYFNPSHLILATDLLVARHSVGLFQTRQMPTVSHFGEAA